MWYYQTQKPAMVAEVTEIERVVVTTNYELHLVLCPDEDMLTMDQARTSRSGEVMVSGQMMTMMGMMPNLHLDLRVYDAQSGAPITHKNVTIIITNDVTKEAQDVPIAALYGVALGPYDTHFGNNVFLTPGAYTIVVNVDGETATFHINIIDST